MSREKLKKVPASGILAWRESRPFSEEEIALMVAVIYFVDTLKIVALKFPTFWFEATPQGKFMFSVAFRTSKILHRQFKRKHFAWNTAKDTPW